MFEFFIPTTVPGQDVFHSDWKPPANSNAEGVHAQAQQDGVLDGQLVLVWEIDQDTFDEPDANLSDEQCGKIIAEENIKRDP